MSCLLQGDVRTPLKQLNMGVWRGLEGVLFVGEMLENICLLNCNLATRSKATTPPVGGQKTPTFRIGSKESKKSRKSIKLIEVVLLAGRVQFWGRADSYPISGKTSGC
jgi:hypothetical protein